jgi:hypothetical protein
MDEASYLRAKAAQCRRLAKAVTGEATAQALEEMAGELERRAVAVEAGSDDD